MVMNGDQIVQQELADLSNTLPSEVLIEAPDDVIVLQTAEPASLDSTSPIPMLPMQPGEKENPVADLIPPPAPWYMDRDLQISTVVIVLFPWFVFFTLRLLRYVAEGFVPERG